MNLEKNKISKEAGKKFAQCSKAITNPKKAKVTIAKLPVIKLKPLPKIDISFGDVVFDLGPLPIIEF